jgi:glycine/D-amino acid oxidase-like deaminating enzyme
MKTVIEEAREIKVVKETDFIVIGGGIAGISAAVAARRCGAEVTLIERSVCLGGLATNGLVCVYFPLDDGGGNRIFGGLTEELLHVCIKYGYNNLPDCWKAGFDPAGRETKRYQTHYEAAPMMIALLV